MRVGIVGSKKFCDYLKFKLLLRRALRGIDVDSVVSGGAHGVDIMAARWAGECGFELIEFPPNWDRDGRAAVFVRNKKIVNNSDVLVAVWDMKSRDIKDAIKNARKKLKMIIIVDYLNNKISMENIKCGS